MSNSTRPCAFCDGEISATAKKCRHCGEWLTDPAGATPTPSPNPTPSGGQASRTPVESIYQLAVGPGTRFRDRYRIVRELGKGGMARVYEAFDKLEGGSVALKVLPVEVMSDERLQRALHREARLVKELRHDRIRAVYHFDIDPERGAFLVMELVEGLSLDSLLLQRERLTPAEVVSVARQAAEALEYAHRKGVVHRDIKPTNLFLTSLAGVALDRPIPPARMSTKLMDFGLGSLVRESVARKSTLDLAGTGTPEYMSPEQYGGDPPTPKSDIYSLGATLYELLAGEPPVNRRGDLRLQILEKPPRRIDDCPAPLWTLIEACLAKRPEARPQSGAEILAQLDSRSPRTANPPRPTRPSAAPSIIIPKVRVPDGFKELPSSHRFFPKKPHRLQIEAAKGLGVPLAVAHQATGMPMVLIPSGQYWMGAVPGDETAADHEKPRHQVNIEEPFWMGVTPVTVREWMKFASNLNTLAHIPAYFNFAWQGQEREHPIVNVAWDDAQEFCKWAGLRLPSEAEWESAGRGGLEGRKYPWGDEEAVANEGAKNGAWWFWNETQVVGYYGANGFGLFDVAGNVQEWTGDEYSWGRVLRGGSWYIDPTFLRVSDRSRVDSDYRGPNTGFRCARDASF